MSKVRKYIPISVIAVLWFVLPPAFLNAYWIDVFNSIGIYALLALSLNIIVGDAGLFNLGHAAFYAVGAYTAAILNTQFHIPILYLLPVSALSAGLFALLIARPIIHLRGDYLCIVTIGIGEIVRIALINNLFDLTGGANGIFGISRPSLVGFTLRTPYHFFFLIWGITVLCAVLFSFLKQSRFGRALDYLREDEIAAQGCGINTSYYKLAAFVLGAAFAGVAGNLYASKMTIISPESFTFWESVLMFAIVILGGSGSIPGMFVGALLVIGLPELFRDFANARMLIFGAAMILMMLFRTQGLLPQKPRKYLISPSAGQEVEAS